MRNVDIDKQYINTIRTLAMDAVQKAGSGHPGTAMALAPAAYVLWNSIMKYNPKNPHWFSRDRFVLSKGHASILQYIMLHLTEKITKTYKAAQQERDKPSLIILHPHIACDAPSKQDTDSAHGSPLSEDEVKARTTVEAGAALGWKEWVSNSGTMVSVDRFGSSAPYEDNFTHYGFMVDNVVEHVKKSIELSKS